MEAGAIRVFPAKSTFAVEGRADIQARAVGSGTNGRFKGTATVGSEAEIEVSQPLLAGTDAVVVAWTGGTQAYRIPLRPASGFVVFGTSGHSFGWKVV